MALQLEQTKSPGDHLGGRRLRISTSKDVRFVANLRWQGVCDVDAHALACTMTQNGPRVYDLARVLSTFNTDIPLKAGGRRFRGDSRPFQLPDRSLVHSGDARDGDQRDIDESIGVDGTVMPPDVDAIPFFVSTFDKEERGRIFTFQDVPACSIEIVSESGRVLGHYELTREYARFQAVRIGMFVFEGGGWNFVAAGIGYNFGFEGILNEYSS